MTENGNDTVTLVVLRRTPEGTIVALRKDGKYMGKFRKQFDTPLGWLILAVQTPLEKAKSIATSMGLKWKLLDQTQNETKEKPLGLGHRKHRDKRHW